MITFYRLLFWSSLAALCLLASCKTGKSTSSNRYKELRNSYCTPNIPYHLELDMWQDPAEVDWTGTNISAHDQLVCEILGISQPVRELALLKKTTGDQAALRRLVLLQKISRRLLIAQSELQAVAAELDCEGERADMAGAFLENLDDKRSRELTVGSVIVGAFTTVATVIISGNVAQAVVGAGGGLISAGLGALTINPKGRSMEFMHERNLLRPIWSDQRFNSDYPGFVWRMLHERKFSNKGELTLSESIKQRWVRFEFEGETKGERQDLIFGSGGIYQAETLQNRSAMINQLQSTIRSINQELTGLIFLVENL